MGFLSPTQGELQPPIRAEIFGQIRFAQHGRSLGLTHRVALGSRRLVTFFPRLQHNIQVLRQAHRYMATQAAAGYDISPAAEWLLDNFHLIESQLKAIHDGLPRSYFRALPFLLEEPLAGLPRIYGVAWAFVAHTDGAFNEELLISYLSAYQESRELNLNEMWALPTTLRVVLIESLRRLAERLAAHKAARELANRCCDHLDAYPVDALEKIVAQLKPRGVDQVFLVQMTQRLHEGGAIPNARHSEPHELWLAQALPDLARLQIQQTADQTADNLSMSNAVTSLRAIGDADWPDIVARASALMQVMLTLPSFAAEHTITRDQTLHALERLARQGRISELLVARTLMALMPTPATEQTSAPEAFQASYWLEGAGRPELLKALGMHESVAFAWNAHWRRWAAPTYLLTLLACSLGLVAWLLLRHGGVPFKTSGPIWIGLGALLMMWPASEAVVALINRLVSESAHPQHLPRLAMVQGISAEHRVLVVIPGMLVSPSSIHQLVHRLELHFLANPERHAQFALLTDWVDSPTAQRPDDQSLLEEASACLTSLNARHTLSAINEGDVREAPRFILLHRERSFSESEQCWIGWERKRGKLELLIADLAEGSSEAFINLGPISQIDRGEHSCPGVRYIVTLDSDTQLPPGRLRELVGVAAHPSNVPRMDATGRHVEAGYGILQPRVVTPLPTWQESTPFHWLFSGQCGTDPYSTATSEVYQDLFGEGTFMGKGLLHVQAVHAVLARRWPDELVLSHDLLEGSIARCATVTDVTLIEDAPFHADVAASRIHRWTRGDWQLLQLMLGHHPRELHGIKLWKMLDNLRRSLVAPASLALMVLTLCGLVISPWYALLLVVASLTAGPLMGALAALVPSRHAVVWQRFYGMALIDVGRALVGGLWLLAQMLQRSMMSLDAIARACWRMAISRRHLLEWTTSASAQASAQTDLPRIIRAHWQEPALAMAGLGALLALHSPHPVLAAVLGLLWASSPLWTWLVSRARLQPQDTELSPTERTYLEGVARDTWRFFEQCVGPGDRHLPPDNLQTMPHDMVAHRTSPTNIGLYLLSTACAREFGWINTGELIDRLQATLATLGTLQRHQGHFLNWYDTQTGEPLLPRYVSTVDSGNLSGHLLTVAQACLALSTATDQPPLAPAQAHQLAALAQACEALAWSAEFGFLYHRKRHLFHLGFLVDTQQLDAGFYDLLASESRLTGLLAIARGDAPVNHWSLLGRPFYATSQGVGLRSWSGSMFEYLMPTLILDEPRGSVLHEACHAALAEQMAFASAQGVPWGISESAYAGQDHTLAYQYAPHGVPRLALRRTPLGELVIAPYATALAAQLCPRLAYQNFKALEGLGARASMGFIEALDFSSARQLAGDICTPVHTFMAHHQGMTIVALANVLLGGVAQRWGMANAHIEAVASVLHERPPREVSRLYAPPMAPAPKIRSGQAESLAREITPGVDAVPPTHLLSNGRYHVALRANGAGWSRWGQIGITRSRDDALRDACGSFIYLRWPNKARGEVHHQPYSITQHPAPDPDAHYQCTFQADRVCFDTTWPSVQIHAKVWVSAEDDIEFRQVEVCNLTDQVMNIELISAFDITLCDPRADETHPAFSNLFVRARWLPEHQALWFERTPRLSTEPRMLAAHFLADADPQIISVRQQTDRQRWLGRNHDASSPLASFDPELEGPPSPAPLDTGLDPVCALAVRLRIAPHAKATLTFATAACEHEATLNAVIDKYQQASHVQRSSLMSATLNGIRMRTLRVTPSTLTATQTLTTALALSLTCPRPRSARPAGLDGQPFDRRSLWRLGISGDRPLILVSISMMQGLGLLRSLGQALQMWSWGGIACDLIVINGEPASYHMPLLRAIVTLSELQQSQNTAPPSFHLLRVDEVSPIELASLHHLARIHLIADGRPLAHHVRAWGDLHQMAQEARQAEDRVAVGLTVAALEATAPKGRFSASGSEFSFSVSPKLRPTRPWINVLSNPNFGTQVSEAGAGFTWAVNSRMNQLTAWSNDPVADPPAEWFLLQDCLSQEIWSVAPSAWGASASAGTPGPFHVTHGQGYTRIEHRRGSLDISAQWCVDAHTSIKQVRVSIVNRGHQVVALRLIGMAEWMMGAKRSDRATVITAPHRIRIQAHQRLALLCTQRDPSGGFGGGTAFLSIDTAPGEREDWTCDRRECFDARGRLVMPERFGQTSGIGLDPCAALSTRITLAPGELTHRVFLMGYAPDAEAATVLLAQADEQAPEQRLAQVRQQWDDLLGTTTVSTPDPLFDAMVNRWLLYQSVSCRLWSKAGFYQAGGATGFRDQLQDAMALVWTAPEMLRQQIVLCASRQFPEGDVQHWWHAPSGAGVRTHFSYDLLWLAHACVHYLHNTGDASLLDEDVPFLEGSTIPPGAEDVYEVPTRSDLSASIYEHAARTIDHSLPVGVHGLPLMGCGDWNDGMNRVGIEGRGESVWLGWFLCQLVSQFAPLAHSRGDHERAHRWEQAAQGWSNALCGPAWDGQWFKRAFFDDGQPLGSHLNSEASIDLIAQAWSVLSNAAPLTQQRMAMAAVEVHLVDHEAGLIKLLDPPLALSMPSAGYIQSYPPGVRENGGQYSHAGVWALMAQAELVRRDPPSTDQDTPYRYFTYLSPAHRAQRPDQGGAYGIEPYVVAGDVYTQAPYVGRGGWSWYSGAAAWLHRAAIESIFGLHWGPEHLSINPCLPSHWPQASLTLKRDGRRLHFTLIRATERDALQTCSDSGAMGPHQLLKPGQLLNWPGLGSDTSLVVPLLA